MTSWVVAWVVMLTPSLWKFAAAAAGLWFGRGIYIAYTRPRLRLIDARKVTEHEVVLMVKRQELLPPWRLLEETWATYDAEGPMSIRVAIREDGWLQQGGDQYHATGLGKQLCNLSRISRTKQADLEKLST